MEDLGVEQFGFNGGMDAFDVGIGVWASRRIEAMLGVVFLFDGLMETVGLIIEGLAIEFGTQIGGDHDF